MLEEPKPLPVSVDTDLDDPSEQERIQNPDPVVVKLSYGDVRLHQPSVATRRRIFGFVTRVFTDAASLPGAQSGALIGTRIASILCTREDLENDLLILVARLMGKPGTITDRQAESLADEISDKASPDDIATLYAQLSILAKLTEVATDPPPQRRRRRG